MANLTDQISASKARQILQDWLGTHKHTTGEDLQDVAKRLKNYESEQAPGFGG